MNNMQLTAGQAEKNPLAQQFYVGALLRFAVPTIIMMVFMGLYTIIDTIFVARFVSTNALSSINIVCPIINIIVGLGTMLAAGGSAAVAQKMGEKDEKGACERFTMVILAGLAVGLLITCIGLAFLGPIIRGLGASDLLFPYCRDYLTILLISAPASMMQVLIQNFLVTAGKPGLGFCLVVAAGLTNALLDFIFIVPMRMGIAGAALATSMGYLIPAIIGIIFFYLNKNGSLYFCKTNFHIRILSKICFNGSSEMIGQLSTAVTTFLFNAAMMKLLGEDGVAAITIIIYSQFFLTAFYIGFTIGVAPIISYKYGSKDYRQLKSIFKICMAFILSASLLVFLLAMAGGSFLVQIFSPKGTSVYEIARNGFLIFPISFLFCGFNIFTSSMFTALSNGKISAILSFLRTMGFITMGLMILPVFYQVNGIWLAVPFAEILSLCVSIFFLSYYRKKYQYI
ncbi:MATE family efflux transporter [Aminipila sp.]|uniref:MATE family efflux transporter n=1 Tax=Aminipila sp. TaxID=2060095 RepID=UPI002F3FF2A6